MERVPCSECTELKADAAGPVPGNTIPRALFAVRLVLAEVDSEGVVHAIDQEPMQLCGVHYALMIRAMNLSALLEMQVSSLMIEAAPQ